MKSEYYYGIFLATSVFVLVLTYLTRDRARKERPIDFALQNELEQHKTSVVTTYALKQAGRVLPKSARERTRVLLEISGLPVKPAEWVVLRFSAALVAGLVFLVLGPDLLLLVGALAGWFLPTLYLKIRVGSQRRRFAEDLPDTLQLIAGSLRSGFSLAASVDAASGHSRDPMASEFKRILARSRVGANLEDGMDEVSVRMQSLDFGWVALAVRIQREVGGNLAEILDSTVETLRERAYLKRQVKSLSAEGRLSAYILLGLPALVGSWAAIRNLEYEALLWTTVPGLVMSVFGLLLMVLGVFWLRSVVRIEP